MGNVIEFLSNCYIVKRGIYRYVYNITIYRNILQNIHDIFRF